MEPIVLVAGKRTPFGRFGGSLKDFSAVELGRLASKAALEQAHIGSQDIDHVVFGNVAQSCPDAAYLARHIALQCGIPSTTPAVTVNRLCGSGFEALADGVRRLRLGEATAVLAGGTENMSEIPFVVRKARFGLRLGHGKFEDFLSQSLFDTQVKLPMNETAENLAVQNSISRAQCDEFALLSHQRASAADFSQEIAPVELPKNKGTLDKDEHVRPDASLESISRLPPLREGGVVSAANASGICDGAAAVVLTTLSNAKEKGWPVLATWIESRVVGVDPEIMGIGPVPAIKELLEFTQTNLSKISLIEINEAFAAQTLAVMKQLQLTTDNCNANGGAIALGHPLAASGTRLIVHLLYALQSKQSGLASACIGGGQGMAVLLEAA